MDTAKDIYDVIVVGAGVEGIATGLFLARRGVRTLILEQFGLYHTKGSSGGESRIIRKTYQEDIYVAMMVDAYKLWGEIQSEFGEVIMRKCGGLTMGLSEVTRREVIGECEAQLRKHKIPHEMVDGREIRKRWPVLNVGDEVIGLFDPTMGVLYSKKAMIAMMGQFLARGGVVRENRKVSGIKQLETKFGQFGQTFVEVTSGEEAFLCKKLILCTGPWTNKLLSLVNLELPISPQKVIAPFWEILPQNGVSRSISETPIFSFWKGLHELYYALPEYEHPGCLKIAPHESITCDADQRGRIEDSQFILAKVTRFISETFQPGLLGNKPSITEECIYTATRDTHPIIDKHPIFRNIYFCTGFSGHGFKLAPVIGQLVTDMVCETEPKFDLKYFSLGRFTRHKL